ncbi:MAG: tRNA pseudouridine(38-40) synthase TruA [Candidatus Algichlamydia australiensis]|nr:tRNA pseudouridine(38-40) synthase TruA [Chlamydiales bacterium]
MNQNIKMIIAYDGAPFFGWQKVAGRPSVEETLERILKVVLQERVTLQAASRTDRGVHARGQVVNFFTEKPIDPFRLKGSLNSLLPAEIRVLDIEIARSGFHPTTDACGKEYRYQVDIGSLQLPFDTAYAFHFPYPIDLKLMQAAIPLIIGKRDFAAFTNAKEIREDTVRELEEILIEQITPQKLLFKIRGKSFLYKMVRNLVGTLLYVGTGKISLDELPQIIASKERKSLGITAPAHGLFLEKVVYPILVS